MIERRQDGERLARVESDVSWIKTELEGQGKICGKTADDVTDIKIMLARQDGQRTTIKWMAHALSVAVGGFFGFMGGAAK